MHYQSVLEQKGIALVAHDSKKSALGEWAKYNHASGDMMISSPLMAEAYSGSCLIMKVTSSGR